jgi:hypothetical protein
MGAIKMGAMVMAPMLLFPSPFSIARAAQQAKEYCQLKKTLLMSFLGIVNLARELNTMLTEAHEKKEHCPRLQRFSFSA